MRIIVLTILTLSLSLGLFAQEKSQKTENKNEPKVFKIVPEFHIKYKKGLLTDDLDFKLTPIAEGKFNLSYYNSNERYVTVKIYDFIGNLILQERVPTQGLVNREYDLSFSKNKMFIVEVGNAKYNKTKSIMAI